MYGERIDGINGDFKLSKGIQYVSELKTLGLKKDS